MQRLWGRKILDLAFSESVSILEYKIVLIKIDRFCPSFKTCSNCGFIPNRVSLKDRAWICPKCKTEHDIDLNASINICRVRVSTFSVDGVRVGISQQPSFSYALALSLRKLESPAFKLGEYVNT
jgi:putative transposase